MSYGDWKYCIGKALQLFPDKTPGAIAKDLECSRAYAYRIESELSTSGQLTKRKKRRGADGKVRSAKRKDKPSPPASPNQPNPEPEPQPSNILEPVAEPLVEPSIEREPETILPLEADMEQSQSFEELLDEYIVLLDKFVAERSLPEERVRIRNRVREWANGVAQPLE